MINPRQGFRPYPIKQSKAGKPLTGPRKQLHNLKFVVGKSLHPLHSESRKTPSTDKSSKRSSMKYRKRKYNLNQKIASCISYQTAGHSEMLKNIQGQMGDSCDEGAYEKYLIFDKIKAPEQRFTGLNMTESRDKPAKSRLSGYYTSEVRRKGKNKLLHDPVLGRYDQKLLINDQYASDAFTQEQQRKNMSVTAYRKLQNLKPQIHAKSIAAKSNNSSAHLPWATSQNDHSRLQRIQKSDAMQLDKSRQVKNKLSAGRAVARDPNSQTNSSQILKSRSPKMAHKQRRNLVSQERKSRRKTTEDSEYLSAQDHMGLNFQNTEKETNMKFLSPTLYEVDELGQAQPLSRGQHQSKETCKYIAMYRTALRNSQIEDPSALNNQSSSRGDLKIQENDTQDYYQDLPKRVNDHPISKPREEVLAHNRSQKTSARKNVGFVEEPEKGLKDFALPVIKNLNSECKAKPHTLVQTLARSSKNPFAELKTKLVTPVKTKNSASKKLQRCISEKNMENRKNSDLLDQNKETQKAHFTQLSKKCLKRKLDMSIEHKNKSKGTLENKIKRRSEVAGSKVGHSAIRPNMGSKDMTKITDYDSVVKPKKPRVPKTRRARLMLDTSLGKNFPSLEQKCNHKPTSIQIVKSQEWELEHSRINQVLKDFSDFCKLTFKHKGEDFDFPHIKHLAKKFGIIINKQAILESGFKDKSISAPIKEKLLFHLWATLNAENGFSKPSGKVAKGYAKTYKFFVGKGNNSQVIKAIMNQRFWWQSHAKEDLNELNFLWTQWKVNSELNKLPSKIAKPIEPSAETSSSGEEDETEDTVKVRPSSKYMQVIDPGHNLPCHSKKLYNRVENNYHLSNKKSLFVNMKQYYESKGENPFDVLPLTFHVKGGSSDPEFASFKTHFYEQKELAAQDDSSQNVWIIKPGENSNRGDGISVSNDFYEIKSILDDLAVYNKRTCIIQKYIEKPLLVKKRKFDIRVFAMLTCFNQGYTKGYFYNEGYLRTSCKEFNLDDLDNTMIHLTNDAVQKHDEDYGRFELANKLSYEEFQKYLDTTHADKNICFFRDILPQIKTIITESFKAVNGKVDPYQRDNTFEIFGYDFMIDEDFKIYLIEVNTNPCLDRCCPLLSRLIPSMLQNSFMIGLDPLFMPPEGFMESKAMQHEVFNKYELVFESKA